MKDSTLLSPDLSIIIVNYHAKEKLDRCLSSLNKENQSDIHFEIIVVDNDPDELELNAHKSNHNSVKFINNKGNFGFAHGCNTGVLHASGATLLFLNPDTQVPKDKLNVLLSEFQKLPPFSILSANKINAKGKPERIAHFFTTPLTVTRLGKAIHRRWYKNHIKHAFSDDKVIVHPEWVSGSVVMMNKADFEVLDGWDTRYWMYGEDADLCMRARNQGGCIALLKSVQILHEHGGSSRANPATTALTKTEVLISHHVFTHLNYHGLAKWIIQLQYILGHLFVSTFWMLMSLFAWTHPKAKIKRKVFFNLLSYYIRVLRTGSWLSPRALAKEQRLNTLKTNLKAS